MTWGTACPTCFCKENGKPRLLTVGHSSHSCFRTAAAELLLTVGEALQGTNIQQG